jgi:hypothetical protein
MIVAGGQALTTKNASDSQRQRDKEFKILLCAAIGTITFSPTKLSRSRRLIYAECELEKRNLDRMKNNGQESNDLLAVFTDNLKSWHIVLFYEEPEHARVIEFQFIRNGLKKEQFCCYITHENMEFIENEMVDNGIDVAYYMKNNMLRIIESIDILDDSRGVLAASDAETKKMCVNLSTHFIIVGELSIRDTLNMINNSKIGDRLTSAQLEIEQNFHNQSFDGLKGYWLCSYQVNDIKSVLDRGSSNKNLIMAELLKSHHGVVFATKSGKGLSLYLP